MAKNKYMLITVIDHEICTAQFSSFDQVRKTMLEELGEDVLKHTEATREDWDELCEKNNYFAADRFEYGNDSAWSNLDKENKKSWLIVSLD